MTLASLKTAVTDEGPPEILSPLRACPPHEMHSRPTTEPKPTVPPAPRSPAPRPRREDSTLVLAAFLRETAPPHDESGIFPPQSRVRSIQDRLSFRLFRNEQADLRVLPTLRDHGSLIAKTSMSGTPYVQISVPDRLYEDFTQEEYNQPNQQSQDSARYLAGKPLPEPSQRRGRRLVTAPVLSTASRSMHQVEAFNEDGVYGETSDGQDMDELDGDFRDLYQTFLGDDNADLLSTAVIVDAKPIAASGSLSYTSKENSKYEDQDLVIRSSKPSLKRRDGDGQWRRIDCTTEPVSTDHERTKTSGSRRVNRSLQHSGDLISAADSRTAVQAQINSSRSIRSEKRTRRLSQKSTVTTGADSLHNDINTLAVPKVPQLLSTGSVVTVNNSSSTVTELPQPGPAPNRALPSLPASGQYITPPRKRSFEQNGRSRTGRVIFPKTRKGHGDDKLNKAQKEQKQRADNDRSPTADYSNSLQTPTSSFEENDNELQGMDRPNSLADKRPATASTFGSSPGGDGFDESLAEVAGLRVKQRSCSEKVRGARKGQQGDDAEGRRKGGRYNMQPTTAGAAVGATTPRTPPDSPDSVVDLHHHHNRGTDAKYKGHERASNSSSSCSRSSCCCYGSLSSAAAAAQSQEIEARLQAMERKNIMLEAALVALLQVIVSKAGDGDVVNGSDNSSHHYSAAAKGDTCVLTKQTNNKGSTFESLRDRNIRRCASVALGESFAVGSSGGGVSGVGGGFGSGKTSGDVGLGIGLGAAVASAVASAVSNCTTSATSTSSSSNAGSSSSYTSNSLSSTTAAAGAAAAASASAAPLSSPFYISSDIGLLSSKTYSPMSSAAAADGKHASSSASQPNSPLEDLVARIVQDHQGRGGLRGFDE